jgi:hypothetical protein
MFNNHNSQPSMNTNGFSVNTMEDPQAQGANSGLLLERSESSSERNHPLPLSASHQRVVTKKRPFDHDHASSRNGSSSNNSLDALANVALKEPHAHQMSRSEVRRQDDQHEVRWEEARRQRKRVRDAAYSQRKRNRLLQETLQIEDNIIALAQQNTLLVTENKRLEDHLQTAKSKIAAATSGFLPDSSPNVVTEAPPHASFRERDDPVPVAQLHDQRVLPKKLPSSLHGVAAYFPTTSVAASSDTKQISPQLPQQSLQHLLALLDKNKTIEVSSPLPALGYTLEQLLQHLQHQQSQSTPKPATVVPQAVTTASGTAQFSRQQQHQALQFLQQVYTPVTATPQPFATSHQQQQQQLMQFLQQRSQQQSYIVTAKPAPVVFKQPSRTTDFAQAVAALGTTFDGHPAVSEETQQHFPPVNRVTESAHSHFNELQRLLRVHAHLALALELQTQGKLRQPQPYQPQQTWLYAPQLGSSHTSSNMISSNVAGNMPTDIAGLLALLASLQSKHDC